MEPIMTTIPEHNRPHVCQCEKCGKTITKGPWQNPLYRKVGSHRYSYEKDNIYEGLNYPTHVTLCDKCTQEELNAGRIQEEYVMH